MKSLCLLVHAPFSVVLNVWNVDDPEEAVACTLEAMDTSILLSHAGFVPSLAVITDDPPIEICGHQSCLIRRSYIEEVLNYIRCKPGTPLQDIVRSN